MAVTQLAKSEISLMLSNAAAGLDRNKSELLWDTETKSFVVVNGSGLNIPGKKGDEIAASKESGISNGVVPDYPENTVVSKDFLLLS